MRPHQNRRYLTASDGGRWNQAALGILLLACYAQMFDEGGMTITLTYTKDDGTQEQIDLEESVTVVDLHYRNICAVDLAPLSSCESLEQLHLTGNRLQSIDLTSLSDCTALRLLGLDRNQLQRIDLTPLSACTPLFHLSIRDNQLQSIDLTPLAGCTDLRDLRLDHNQLQSIDLTPLASCTALQELPLGRNQLQSIDLHPLSGWASLWSIDLHGNQLQSIDLTPLSASAALTHLMLGGNQFKSIDLTPLSSCVALTSIALDGNQLQSIDLTHLSTCSTLTSLSLNSNQLQHIDLTPLSACTALEYLGIRSNQLQSIDLAPLSSCAVLKALWLEGNQIQSIDLSPLSTSTALHKLEMEGNEHLVAWIPLPRTVTRLVSKIVQYQRPMPLTYPWSFLHRVMMEHGSDWRIQQDILMAMGLGDYGFIDADVQSLLSSIPQETTLECACERVIPELLEIIRSSVERGGPTTGLNLEKIALKHGEIAAIAPAVIEARHQELEAVRVGWRESAVDLRELAVTAYGYDLMSSQEIRRLTGDTIREYQPLLTQVDFLKELGHEVKFSEEPVPGVQMSDELKKAIWFILENQGETRGSEKSARTSGPQNPPYP